MVLSELLHARRLFSGAFLHPVVEIHFRQHIH